MSAADYTGDEIVRLGEAVYDRSIRSEVEAGNKGKFLVINVETGEYEMDEDDLVASKRAKNRFPEAPLFAMRVGFSTTYNLGARLAATEP